MEETSRLLGDFFKGNKALVIATVITEMSNAIIENIVVPIILADAFNNIKDVTHLRNQLFKLSRNPQSYIWLIRRSFCCSSPN